jgi:glycosyltransferase involved in cell wall biosynthesis
VQAAVRYWERRSRSRGEIIVVDNASSDGTARIANNLGARVVRESVRNIAHVRNTGAAAAGAPLLFFVDADVALPREAIDVAVAHLRSGTCVGGAIPPLYAPRRLGARLLCGYWDWHRRRHGGAQGVAQFCTADAFRALHGYRTDLYMSEDVEFFRRLREYGDACGRPVVIVDELRVRPSTRRYDQWPTWRMVFWQNPITARTFLTSPRFWRHWYDTTVR